MDFAYDYGYGYSYPHSYYSYDDSILDVIVPIYLLVLTVVLVFVLISYIFDSIGLYTIGKRMGKAHPWLAFVPFARDYFHGELAGGITFRNKSLRHPGIWKLILPIAYAAVAGVVTGIMILAVSIGALVGSPGSVITGIMFLIVLVIFLLVLGVIYSAGYFVLQVMVDIQIFERFTTRNMAVVHAVLSMVVPLYEALCLFVMRNRAFNPGMEPAIESAPDGEPPVPPVAPNEFSAGTGEAPSAAAENAPAAPTGNMYPGDAPSAPEIPQESVESEENRNEENPE